MNTSAAIEDQPAQRAPPERVKTALAKPVALCLGSPLFSGNGRQNAGRFRRGGWWQGALRINEKRFMAVKIRMKRIGAKNQPAFRIVVADARSPRDGKCLEEIGTYQPLRKGDNVKLDLARAQYWLGKGAQPSETVASFLKKAGKAAAAAAAPA